MAACECGLAQAVYLPGRLLFDSSLGDSQVAWLFERTVELAAWLALIVAWASMAFAVYFFVLWCGTLQSEVDFELLRDAAKSAGAAVAFALALGGLACVDRYIFDADE